ncbi:RDD family protein [Sporomusa sp.]|uniref:RDD family protein n=1 Tax=Sporomusa sp. TaxID=2078658 RepID=UPI002B748453|nr:RDD family protein [Sporomusa sp.]HWR07924.1 RDD family protein [Sporomusa sp.]
MEGAGVGIRALSTIVDGIILAVIGGAITAGLGGAHYLWSMLIGFCYYTYFESYNGATPGKMLCGLKVVKTDGTPCDLNAAAVRTACRLIDGLFVYLVGAVLIWTSVNNQRLGDRLADTLVVKVQ